MNADIKVNNQPLADVDLRAVHAVIYWKAMDEIDVYVQNAGVRTIKGAYVKDALVFLQSKKILVETVE